jgi:hypothetical protein
MPDEILQKFKAGEFPDKTFSRLYAPWLGIPTTQALIMEFQGSQAGTCYSVTPDIEDFLTSHDYYIIVYDFRAHFKNLEQWMKEKKNRPRPIKCTKADVAEHLEQSIKRACAVSDDFFIHVNVRFLHFHHLMCTVNGDKTYIECSDDYDTAHGKKGAHLCVVQKGEVVVNETGVPDDILVEAADYTGKLTAYVGDNTTCEFSLVDGLLYFYTGQKSSSKVVTLPGSETDRTRVVSPGTVRGTVKHVNKASLSEGVAGILNPDKKYVFVAEKPYSEFVALLNYAEGFIFREGSMLCHLAILLREKGIPARIIPHTEYEDGSNIALE